MLHPLKKLNLLLGVFVLLIFACDKWDFDRAAFIQIITVGAIEVGSNDAFLLGDIDGLRNTEITETGFVVSPTVSDETRLRLDQTGVVQAVAPTPQDTVISQDQAFAARITNLGPQTKYFFRAYAKLQGDESAYGVIDTFTTSNLIISLPSIVRNQSGCPGSTTLTIEIEGYTAAGMGTAGVVWSSDENNEFPTLNTGNLLESVTPDASGTIRKIFDIDCNTTYFLRGFVTINGQTTYGKMLAFSTVEGGIWLPKANYPGQLRGGSMLYSDNARGYISGGNQALSHGEIWAYEDELDNWKLEIYSDKLGLHDGIGFVQNGIHNFMTGRLPHLKCGQVEECKNCSSCSCVETGTGPQACDCYLDSLIRLYPEDLPTMPIEAELPKMKGAIGLLLDNRLILGGGEAIQLIRTSFDLPPSYGPECIARFNVNGVNRFCYANFVTYNLKTSKFSKIDPLPGDSRFRISGFSIGDLGYVGLGIKCTHDTRNPEVRQDFYQLDLTKPSGQQWTSVSSIPSILEARTSFALGDDGYVITSDNNNQATELWRFDPIKNQGEWSLIKPPPNNWISLIGSFTIGNRAFIYFSGIAENFWMYVPELD